MVVIMREKQFFVNLDEYEHNIIIDSLNEKKKQLKLEGRHTDAVDDLIVKVAYAPQQKFKVIEKGKTHNEAR